MHPQNLNSTKLKVNCEGVNRAVKFCCAILFVLYPFVSAGAQKATPEISVHESESEKRAELNLQAAKSNPLALRHFLLGMPKGADLHNHLAGAVYAESWIRVAVESNLCVDPVAHSLSRPQGDGSCPTGHVAASEALKKQSLYDGLVDAFSMRNFVPSSGVSGHDHFFATFDKFQEAYSLRPGEYVDEIVSRAAAQNEQYLELMHTPSFARTAAIAREIGWKDDLALLRKEILNRGIAEDITHAKAELDQMEQIRRQREHCGQPDATAGCQVEARYLCQVLRGFPKEIVFGQTLFCFELAAVDPRYVGINFVMPEDGYVSMTDYDLQMRMVAFLHDLYPKVHVSLHAGELAPGLVPYEGLCCHIRKAVEQAHAERIGHGVDVMYEDHPHELLKEMAAKHVMVEINLTSNDVILGVNGKDHPLPIYRQFHVPVALSTDDEGVSRIDLTHEYARSVETYGLGYVDLKQIVRTGMEHSFLPGASLWAAPDDFTRAVGSCSHDALGADKPSARCKDFLNSSDKANAQWELESRFKAFESSL
jgi:adenosine deaminase